MKSKILMLLLLMAAGMCFISCTKRSGCKYVKGLNHTGIFQYYENPIDSMGYDVRAKLEYDYYDETNTIYFIGEIPKEFRTEQRIVVNVACEPIYVYQDFPLFYRIKCIEKID